MFKKAINLIDILSRWEFLWKFLIGFCFAIFAFAVWFRAIIPVLFRLGKGLSNRQIAIFAKGDNLDSLKQYLVDSKLFNTKNIIEIRQKSDLHSAEGLSMFVVDWSDWGDDIDSILSKKQRSTALLVYAKPGAIQDTNILKRLDEESHFLLCNFRGRLVNDIVSSMITTSI